MFSFKYIHIEPEKKKRIVLKRAEDGMLELTDYYAGRRIVIGAELFDMILDANLGPGEEATLYEEES